MDLDHLKEIILSCCPGTDLSGVDGQTKLKDIGLDSLDLAQIIFEIEGEEGIEIDADSIESIETIGDALREIEAAGN